MGFEPWELLAGLGLFLFGMLQLELALKGLGTVTFRHMLRDRTRNPFQGMLVGTLSTAFLQSSSLVGLITLAFVGAGILELKNALGIIFGANLGTTFTGWLVATIGFKLNLEAYAMPLLAAGTLGKVFTKEDSRSWLLLTLVLGIGLLLLGLDYMKASMNFLQENVGTDSFGNYPAALYVLGGIAFTALVQSSSATMLIVLSAVHTGVIPLVTAAYIVIGANLGTTVTLLIGSIHGSPDKRRVALSHFIFNLVAGIVALILLAPLLHLITGVLEITDATFSLVAFHSLINFIGILIFLPVVNPFATFLKHRFTEDQEGGALFVRRVPLEVAETATKAISQDVERLIDKVLVLNLRTLKIHAEELLQGFAAEAVFRDVVAQRPGFDNQYADIKKTEDDILTYAYKLMASKIDESQSAFITRMLDGARNAVYSAKSLKDIRQDLIEFRMFSDNQEIADALRHSSRLFYRHLLELKEKTDAVLVQEKSAAVKAEIDAAHQELHQLIYRYIQRGPQGIESSSLLNINRELLISHECLLTATLSARMPAKA